MLRSLLSCYVTRMIRTILVSVLSLGLLASCGSKPAAKQPAAVEATATSDAAESIFVIKAAKLVFPANTDFPDSPHVIDLDASGSVIVAGESKGTLSADGKIADETGKLLATVDAEGVLHVPGMEPPFTIAIARDGSVSRDGAVMVSINENNQLVMDDAMSGQVVFEGPQEAKRPMMAIFIVMMMTGSEGSSSVEEMPGDGPSEDEGVGAE